MRVSLDSAPLLEGYLTATGLTRTMEKSDGSMVLLALISVVALMDCLDGNVVNVALPRIATDMSVDMAAASWVTVIYFAMVAGLIILFGRIAANGSVKRVMMAGLTVFIVGSALCAMSEEFLMLVASRVVQGIGAAMMGAAIPMSCVRFFSPKVMGFAFACVTIGYSVGAALGPSVGGFLVEYLSWHWIFLINIPIGVVLIVLIHFLMTDRAPDEKAHVDWLGGALLFVTITALLMVFEFVEELPICLSSIALFAVMLGLFVRHERRSPAPLLNISMFRSARFDMTITVYFLINVVYLGALYVLPFFMSICMGLSSSESGMLLLIPAAITLVFGLPIGRWSDRTGRRWFSMASGLLTALMCVLLMLPGSDTMPVMVCALVAGGLTWAFCGGPVMSRVVETVSGESREMGSTMTNEAGYLGSTVGTVLFAVLFAAVSGTSGVDISSLSPDVFAVGMTGVMAVGAILAIVSAILSFAVRDE